MFNRDGLLALYDYTEFTWQTYANAIGQLPPEALRRPVEGSGWPSLDKALFHIAAGWDGWLRDRAGATDALPSDGDAHTWDDIAAIRTRTRGWMRAVLGAATDGDLAAPTELMSPGTAAEWRATPGQVLAHILLHERGHHGDITTLIAALGGTPAASDYLVYRFFEQRKAGRS